MRIAKKGENEAVANALAAKTTPSSDISRRVEFGIEDIILARVLGVLIVGYARGQLTVQDFLTYLGVTGAGGLWGMLGGTSSSKG